MKEVNKRKFGVAIGLLAAFVIWTVVLCYVDVQVVGPQGTAVGFATVNTCFHSFTGVHMSVYTITDWLGLVPIGFVLGFAFLGLLQLIKRKSLFKVDESILVLGGFYVVVMAVYLFFEFFIINYRPVLIEGQLEASYPSSTTMLAMCVLPTAILQLKERIANRNLYKVISGLLGIFTVFMVAARLISGVHWLTDIIGGALISAGLVTLYIAICDQIQEKHRGR